MKLLSVSMCFVSRVSILGFPFSWAFFSLGNSFFFCDDNDWLAGARITFFRVTISQTIPGINACGKLSFFSVNSKARLVLWAFSVSGCAPTCLCDPFLSPKTGEWCKSRNKQPQCLPDSFSYSGFYFTLFYFSLCSL